MCFEIDKDFLTDCFRRVVNIPSPSGFFEQMNACLESYAAQFGASVFYDNRHTFHIALEGCDNSKTVLIGAHADTLGMIVRGVNADGSLRFRVLGGMNMHSAEGESVQIHTLSGKIYTGLVACQAHSTHVFRNAGAMERTEETMLILPDAPVKSAEDVHRLGIRRGDYISIMPRCQITENGYIKSRFIDAKAAVACSLTLLKYLTDHNLKPKYRTLLSFPHYEEMGTGGCFVPPEVSEYLAVDIALVGPELEGDERKVTICASDSGGPYDYAMRKRLIACAEKAGCNYAVDVFSVYNSDAHAAERGGNNVSTGLIGMGTYCTHGMERTHIDGMVNTVKLLLAYTLDI